MQRFLPPLLERLTDAAPASPAEPLRPTLSLGQLKDAVARDVEALLNTRRAPDRGSLSGYANARRSTLGFGLDDFASLSLASVADRAAICSAIERAIAEHEPRLRDVQVRLEGGDAARRKVVFSIEATLAVHPAQEPVSFEAMLQPATRAYAVHAGQRAA